MLCYMGNKPQVIHLAKPISYLNRDSTVALLLDFVVLDVTLTNDPRNDPHRHEVRPTADTSASGRG